MLVVFCQGIRSFSNRGKTFFEFCFCDGAAPTNDTVVLIVAVGKGYGIAADAVNKGGVSVVVIADNVTGFKVFQGGGGVVVHLPLDVGFAAVGCVGKLKGKPHTLNSIIFVGSATAGTVIAALVFVVGTGGGGVVFGVFAVPIFSVWVFFLHLS